MVKLPREEPALLLMDMVYAAKSQIYPYLNFKQFYIKGTCWFIVFLTGIVLNKYLEIAPYFFETSNPTDFKSVQKSG